MESVACAISVFRRWSWQFFALGLVITVASGCATQATIHGLVVAPGSSADPDDGAVGLDRGVVYAVPHNGVLPDPAASRTEVRQTHDGFEPAVIMVPRNTEVEFLNQDTVYHNAFSLSPAKPFDVGRVRPGERRTVLFDQVGVIQVFCELHPESWAVVVVHPERLGVRPDSDGSFVFSGLTEGEYSITAWHPTYGLKTQTVTVPRKGRVEFTLAY